MTACEMALVLELDRHPPLMTFPGSRRSNPESRIPSPGGNAPLADTIRAVAGGDRDAFSQLYAAYVRMVHAILLGRVPRRDVDDLVQDVFVTAYTRIRELRDAAAFGGWLATIARNRATDYLRRSREQVELPADLPGGDAIEADTMAVLDVIRKLPEAYRETLLMRLVEGMTGAEIAERSGLTPASVRVNLHRGMKLLREKLGWTSHE
jgi:RNA polymerase sigma-70 factor (ECF subfamily)